jgi:two-component system alkaline phosphatase synthesis response regulator PhoP
MDAPIKILVLEDDHGVTDLLKTVAESDCLQITAVASEQQGLDLAVSLKPDVIILVLDKPDADALAICRQFRQCNRRVPILVLSSNGRPGYSEQILNAGADDYLAKPITSTLVMASLNKLTRRARAEREAIKHNPTTPINPL